MSFQRVNFINSKGINLVGRLFLASPKTVVIMAHGFTGEKTSKGRFNFIAKKLYALNISALAFDFSGCGESDDDSLTVAKQIDDLSAAISLAEEIGFKKIALWGHSLGSLVCLRSYSSQISTMVLTGALTGPMHYKWEDYYSPEQLQELADKQQVTVNQDSNIRQTLIIDAQMLRDFAEIDQVKLLNSVKCPVLIIHGDKGEEELLLLENSRIGMRYLVEGSCLQVIQGADHSFMQYMDQVSKLGLSWLRRHLAL